MHKLNFAACTYIHSVAINLNNSHCVVNLYCALSGQAKLLQKYKYTSSVALTDSNTSVYHKYLRVSVSVTSLFVLRSRLLLALKVMFAPVLVKYYQTKKGIVLNLSQRFKDVVRWFPAVVVMQYVLTICMHMQPLKYVYSWRTRSPWTILNNLDIYCTYNIIKAMISYNCILGTYKRNCFKMGWWINILHPWYDGYM